MSPIKSRERTINFIIYSLANIGCLDRFGDSLNVNIMLQGNDSLLSLGFFSSYHVWHRKMHFDVHKQRVFFNGFPCIFQNIRIDLTLDISRSQLRLWRCERSQRKKICNSNCGKFNDFDGKSKFALWHWNTTFSRTLIFHRRLHRRRRWNCSYYIALTI